MAVETTNGTALPTCVTVGGMSRFSPNEMRLIKAVTGLTMQQLTEDTADMAQALVFVTLRRQGYSVTWEQCGDIEADMTPPEVDPTNGASSPTSPPSVASGG
jgi:hypothetical protein